MERIQYLKQPNRGLSAARNTALRHTQAEFVALLDSDDILLANSLQVQVDYLDRQPSLDVVYGDAIFMGGELSGRRFMDLFPSKGEATFEGLVTRRCNVMVAVLARREALVKSGFFDENLRRSEDLDMWIRMANRGYRFGYHRAPVIRYRRHHESLSANITPMMDSLVTLYEKFLRDLNLSSSQRELVAAQLTQYRADKWFCEAKDEFMRRNFESSARKLAVANAVLRQRRLSLITRLVEYCPELLHWAYTQLTHMRQLRHELT